MSLNGLDNVEVTQAYQSALAEAGGWYEAPNLAATSDHHANVLCIGSCSGTRQGMLSKSLPGELVEQQRRAMLWRSTRRNRRCTVSCCTGGGRCWSNTCPKAPRDYYKVHLVISVKHQSLANCITARVSVHFITVTERFAPHDIILSISTPEELSDAALASACTLHTAAPSSSSSSGSSRPQKLSWIQEAAEEVTGEDNASAVRPATASSAIPTILEPTTSNEEEPPRNSSVTSHAESVPLMLEEKVVDSAIVPEVSHNTMGTVNEVPASPESDLTELKETLRSYEKLFEGGPEPRLSSQTARPDYNELYEHYYAQYTKPKVKLGPRPRPSLDGRRPSTSGNASQDTARPVSSLPSGLRSSARKAAEKKESKTRTSSVVPTIAIPPPPPVPMTPEMPHSPVSPAYSSRTPASVKSMPVSAYSSHHRSTGMTQEKTRLMKALELRKKQQKAREEKKEKAAEDNAKTLESASTTTETGLTGTESLKRLHSEPAAASDAGEVPVPTQSKDDPDNSQESTSVDDTTSSLELDSSGLVFTADQPETDDMNSAASVSSPISAETQGSSGAPSTRPSSISEDENACSKDEGKSKPAPEPQVSDTLDEEQSVDSATTVKPGSTTPIPSVEVESHPEPQPTTPEQIPSFDASVQFDPTNVRGLTMPSEEDDARSRRRSKRESTMYIPSGDPFVYDEAQLKRRNRESVLMPTSKRQSWYESKEKRRAMLEPLQVSAENSETEYLSDDSFMEELQSATVHQAKPMSVSKSPIRPFFPRKSTATEVTITTPPRSESQAYQGTNRLSPERSGRVGRTSSGAWPPRAMTDSVVAAKKINVSSGISQRIKALAEKSNKDRSVSPVSPASTLDTSSSTLAQRKSSFFATTPIETSPSSRPATRLGSPSYLPATASTTPEKKKPQGPIKSTVYNVQRETEKAESVQVTARIIRDERTRQPTLAMPTEMTPLDLHQSPLIIDHQKPTYTPKSPTRGRPEPASPRAASSSHSREQSTAPSRTSSESTWRAFGRRMSESKSIHSHDGEEKREEKKDKKESRTSKMFKRMSSSMSSMPWKNSSNNLSLPEHSMTSTSLSSVREPPPPVQLGDLNIQFPDTLLWKRRWAELDAMGNIVLSPSKSNEKGAVKRFHLTEFRTPYPPDQDRQELPNSVVLDFIDGRTLQCACETYVAQAQVLQSKYSIYKVSTESS
jgi:hypothetical protein